ncbi:MAG: MarR family winged helix-turn-helix transcriptional regulator [Gammaproteobacteria bacterium]|nr:MarR family transcriptional regulator [Gammaproteobacteria bacterium]
MKHSIEEQVLIELRRILRATQLNARALARESGMTTSQLIVLQILKAHGEMTARQIAESMNLTQATVTSLLDRLQERGWIVRRRGEKDRRRVHVRISAEGERQLARAPQSLQERFVNQFVALPPWEQSAILAALQRVAHLLDAASIDASPVLDIGRIDRAADEPTE